MSKKEYRWRADGPHGSSREDSDHTTLADALRRAKSCARQLAGGGDSSSWRLWLDDADEAIAGGDCTSCWPEYDTGKSWGLVAHD